MQLHRRGLFMTLCIPLGAAWLGYALAGDAVARLIAGRLGEKLLRAADGKFADPATFISGRIGEALVLATVFAALASAAVWIWHRLGCRPATRPLRGLVMGLVLFVMLNLSAWFAGRTALFWAAFHDKEHVNNFVQYQIKKALLGEEKEKRRMIIMGNSQANRSIDERIINRELGGGIWAYEMHQPGARGFDLFILSRDIRPRRGDLIVCYVSEISFYGMGSGIVVADFMSLKEVPAMLGMQGMQWISPGAVRSGLLGRLLPIYRFRDPLATRLLGPDIVHIEQSLIKGAPERDLETHAREWAPKLKVSGSSCFEQAAFRRMVEELGARGCELWLIRGHLHPALRDHMDPSVSEDLELFLNRLATRHPQITLLSHDRFFQPQPADFKDLVHFNDAAQERFTRDLAGILKNR